MSQLTLGLGHRATVFGIPAVVQSGRSRPRLRGLAYVLVDPPSLGSPGLETVAGGFTLARFQARFQARFLAALGIDV